jgi:ribonuclease D
MTGADPPKAGGALPTVAGRGAVGPAASAPADVTLVATPADLARVAGRAARAPRVAVDAEANGLFAFRPSLCTLQLAWPEGEHTAVAVVDTLAVAAAPLGPLLGPDGPIKVLHDLTFDARLLADAGAPLARVRDTSVAARLLGFTATGLASLLASELGVHVGKELQQHDWGRRPLAAEHVAYLAGDVRHLLALDAHLERRAGALDLGPEIDEECAHKLGAALGPPRDGRPAYVRIKGAAALDPAGRAVLRRLVEARDEVSRAADLPPFKVVSSEVLLELARRRPGTPETLAAVRGALAGRAGRHAEAWLAAVAAGVRDGDVPGEDRAHFAPPRPDRELAARRRAREAALSAWRRAEAALRGVDEQAVLPGHCAQDLVDALLDNDQRPDPAALAEAIARIPGLGVRRLARYREAFVALASPPPAPRAAAPSRRAPFDDP